MQVQSEVANEKRPLYVLSTALTIESIENLARELRKLIAESSAGTELTLDASKVEIITTPAVQMIIALGKILERNKGSIIIKTPSETFSKAFETLGLSVLLDKWSLI